jgi:molybdopterin-guanine dinucleotide biosynthesis protein B
VTPVVAVSGRSGAGKTRLLGRLIPALARRGVSCAVVKHTRHPHAFDRPGKDTDVLRRAGAIAAAITGPREMAWFGPAVRGLDSLAAAMPRVGVILAEGFRDAPVPRIEVHRRAVWSPFLCARDPRVFAVVTDEPPPRTIPAFGPDDVEPLAELLCAKLGLGRAPRGGARLRPRPPVSSPEFHSRVGRKGGPRSAAARREAAQAASGPAGGTSRRGGGPGRTSSRRNSRSSR